MHLASCWAVREAIGSSASPATKRFNDVFEQLHASRRRTTSEPRNLDSPTEVSQNRRILDRQAYLIEDLSSSSHGLHGQGVCAALPPNLDSPLHESPVWIRVQALRRQLNDLVPQLLDSLLRVFSNNYFYFRGCLLGGSS